MGNFKKIALIFGCLFLLLISWLVVLSNDSDLDKQRALKAQAEDYLEDDIYIRALPLLQNAASYKTELTSEINQMLKETYVALGDYRSYIDFLTILMSEKNPSADVFSEAAEYYLDTNKFKEAIAVLVDGISKTNDAGLIDLYEEYR